MRSLYNCSTHGCAQPPAFRYTWPGRPEAGLCAACAPKVRAVARALELELELHEVSTRELSDDAEAIHPKPVNVAALIARGTTEQGARELLDEIDAQQAYARKLLDAPIVEVPIVARVGADDVELERVKAFAKARGLELHSTVLLDSVRESHIAIEKDIDDGRAKLRALARRLRELATFQLENFDNGKLRHELYDIADQMEDL